MATEGIDGSGTTSEVENDLELKLLRDRFRLSAISIAESEGSIQFFSHSLFIDFYTFFNFSSEKQLKKIRVPNSRFRFAANKSGMEVSKVVVACVADLAFKYTGNIQLSFFFFLVILINIHVITMHMK
jgi:hypothetical protein